MYFTRCLVFRELVICGLLVTARHVILIGATSGRTTLNGRVYKYQMVIAIMFTIPNCVSYDPTYAYEMAVIIQDGLHRMYEKQENKFITLLP